MSKHISNEALNNYRGMFFYNKLNHMRMRAVVKNGLEAASEDHTEAIENPMIFSIELETGKITEQKSTGRCWLFAALNTMRLEIMRKLNLETFELSQNYMMFFDKLEKANFFLENIIETAGEPLESRLLFHLLAGPVFDGGQWDMFCALVDKYGCVPKSIMPETFHSSNTARLNSLLTLKLREDAYVLRKAVSEGASVDKLRDMKDNMLADIYCVLCICLGEPPRDMKFNFEYRDKDKVFHADYGIKPREFYEKYVGQALDDYVSIINAPTDDKPYYKTYTVAYLGNVVGGREIKYLNLPIEELKWLAIAQLKDQTPVWFGCDVGQMLRRDAGIMGMNTYDYEGITGMKFGLSKAQRLDYSESLMTHAMVFLGVNLVDGVPTRWKVENSWGKKSGQNGYYIMTDEWFDEFNYQVVVDKKYLSAAQREAYDQEPVTLKPWDPMGSLA